MARIRYSDEIKEQIVKECCEIGNTALVARQYNISKHTVAGLKRLKKLEQLDLF